VRAASCSPRAGAASRVACALALVLAVATACGSEAARRREIRSAEAAAQANLYTLRAGLADTLRHEVSPAAVVDDVRWQLEPRQDPWTRFLLSAGITGTTVTVRVAVLGPSETDPFGFPAAAYAAICADLSGTWPGPAIVTVRQVRCPARLPDGAPHVDSVLQPVP
jgi:hypothetical protein